MSAKIPNLQWDATRAMAPATCVKELSDSDPTFPEGATLYVESGGTVKFTPFKQAGEVTMTFADATFVPIRMKAVDVAGSSATGIFAIW
jgi:hypothetical protein